MAISSQSTPAPDGAVEDSVADSSPTDTDRPSQTPDQAKAETLKAGREVAAKPEHRPEA